MTSFAATLPASALHLRDAPAPGIDNFLLATNRFLERINLEFNLSAHISRERLQELAAHAETAPITCSNANPPYYRRILYADPAGHFSLAAITWPPGSMTPVHTHFTWCSFMVVSGVLTERRFAMPANSSDGRVPQPGRSITLGAGAHRADERFGGIHQLANQSDGTAVSLHFYGVAGDRAATHVNRILELGTTHHAT